jgi:hypothetical protein
MEVVKETDVLNEVCCRCCCATQRASAVDMADRS